MAGRTLVNSEGGLAGAPDAVSLDVVSEEPAVTLCTGLGEDFDAQVRQRLQSALQWVIDNMRLELDARVRDAVEGDVPLSDVPLDSLISVASKHLLVIETCARVDADSMDITSRLRKWIGHWRAAASEAATLGLSGDISHKYWQQNIMLPEEVTKARNWFPMAKKLVKRDPSIISEKLIKNGRKYYAAVAECRSSWPRYRRLSIARRASKWSLLVAQWVYALLLVDLRRKASDAAELRALITKLAVHRLKALRAAQEVFMWSEKHQAAVRTVMLQKRTCAHCGITGPLSQVSFACCGGCRDSGLGREHWTRYCSEACQRAHWLAGHMHFCPLKE